MQLGSDSVHPCQQEVVTWVSAHCQALGVGREGQSEGESLGMGCVVFFLPCVIRDVTSPGVLLRGKVIYVPYKQEWRFPSPRTPAGSRSAFCWEAVALLWPSPLKFAWKDSQKPKTEKSCNLKVRLGYTLAFDRIFHIAELSEGSWQKPEYILGAQRERLFCWRHLPVALCTWCRSILVSDRTALLFWKSQWTHLRSQGCPQIPSGAFARSEAVSLMIQQAIFRSTAGIFPAQRKRRVAHWAPDEKRDEPSGWLLGSLFCLCNSSWTDDGGSVYSWRI